MAFAIIIPTGTTFTTSVVEGNNSIRPELFRTKKEARDEIKDVKSEGIDTEGWFSVRVRCTGDTMTLTTCGTSFNWRDGH